MRLSIVRNISDYLVMAKHGIEMEREHRYGHDVSAGMWNMYGR